MPTHGFGSFTSAGSTGDTTESTIGGERRAGLPRRGGWVAQTRRTEAYPAYYVHMAPRNSSGPEAPELEAPRVADRETVARNIDAGEWVVDLRSRTAFAAGHVTGTLNFGLDGQFSTYLGWLIPWGTPLTLLGESAEQVAEAQRELVRIGIDELAGAATGAPQDWTDGELGSFERATFADLAQVRHHRPVHVLDVRRTGEFDKNHIEDAQNIPLHELLSRHQDVPRSEVWVHCAGGYRASIAASVLAAQGVGRRRRRSFGNATSVGLPIASAS